MHVLTECPACRSHDLVDVDLTTNLTDEHKKLIGDDVIWEADYAYCRRCEMMFARNRQDANEAVDYYAAFPDIEKRSYTVYPPPQQFIDAQEAFSNRFLGTLDGAGLLKPGISVLNIRCEYGVHLAALKQRFGIDEVYGLDHFETNLRYARDDLGLEHLDILDPYTIAIPFERKRYDLILANHQITHALDPVALMRHLRDHVSDDGCVVFYNELDHVGLFDQRKMYRRGVISYHKQLLTRNSLENLCRLSGFAPTFLDHDRVGIKWASGRESMVVAGRPAQPIDPAEAAPPASDSLYDAYLRGRDAHAPIGLVARVRRAFGLEGARA